MSDENSISYTDVQVARWLREGRLDAEIAVRLGISVGEVKERIARLQARTGATDRAELAPQMAISGGSDDAYDWSRPKEGQERAAEPAPSRPEPPNDEPPSPRDGYSLRAIVLAAVGGIVIAGGAVAGLTMLLGEGDSDPGVAPDDATETATPRTWTASPTEPAATATAHPGASAIQRTSGEEWQITRYESGDTTAGPHGIFFMDTATGSSEGYMAVSRDAGTWFHYRAGRGNRLVFANGDGETRMYDRETERTWTWASDTLSVTAANGQYLLVNESVRLYGEQQPSATTSFHLLDADDVLSPGLRPGVVASFTLPIEGRFTVVEARVTDDGRHAVIGIAPHFQNGAYDIYTVDLRTGSADVVEQVDQNNGRLRPFELAADEESFTVLRTLEPKGDGLQPSGYTQASRYNWSGTILGRLEAQGVAGAERVEFSPDGQYAIAETVLAISQYDVVSIRWPLITVYRKVSALVWEPIWRVRSATMVAGDRLEGSHWLADSSGFVANVRVSAEPQAGWSVGRAGVFSVEDGSFEPLPTSELPGGGSSSRADAVLPSPDDVRIFSNHREEVYNNGVDAWYWLESGAPDHLNPWNGASDEMVFAIPDGGHGGGWGAVMLAPLVEFAPLAPIDGVALVVDGDGECLRVRSKPGTTAGILDCLPDGTEVVLAQPEAAPAPPGNWPPDYAPDGTSVHFNPEDQIGFAYVRGGEVEGWVALQYLEWAPDEAHG